MSHFLLKCKTHSACLKAWLRLGEQLLRGSVWRKGEGGVLMPQPIPYLQHTVPGAGTPSGRGSVLLSDRNSSDSSHRSFAKGTQWSQQPGTDTSREVVEKAKAGTENMLSIQSGLKPSLMLDPSLSQPHLSPSTSAVLHSPYLLFPDCLPQISPIPCLSNPYTIFLCQRGRITMPFIITTLLAMYCHSPLMSIPMPLSKAGNCLLPYPLYRAQQNVRGFGWSLVNNTIPQTSARRKTRKLAHQDFSR